MANDATKFDQKSLRRRERIRLALLARVRGRDKPKLEWDEMTRLLDVTPFGARFRLSRPTEPGRLLHLTTAMPRALRVFDHVEDQYRVWTLVRNLVLLDPEKEKGALVEVGVAFIGKQAPKSYEVNPVQRYEAAPTNPESGLWGAADSAAPQLSEVVDRRKESRQLIPVDVLMQVYDDGKLGRSENSVTENISKSGAAVFTALDVAPGTFIKMTNERYQALVLAVVRDRRTGADGITRLHLEFVGSEWPL